MPGAGGVEVGGLDANALAGVVAVAAAVSAGIIFLLVWLMRRREEF